MVLGGSKWLVNRGVSKGSRCTGHTCIDEQGVPRWYPIFLANVGEVGLVHYYFAKTFVLQMLQIELFGIDTATDTASG